jgi:hypothetical protein
MHRIMILTGKLQVASILAAAPARAHEVSVCLQHSHRFPVLFVTTSHCTP